jgi:hypothetical protein
MDKTVIETEFLPNSFKTLHEFLTKTFKENGHGESHEAVEGEKFKLFAKVFHNVQTTYLSLQNQNEVDIGQMIGNMKEDIR